MKPSPESLAVKLTVGLTSTVMTGLTISALLIVIGSPIAGQIVDQLGRKPLLVVSVSVYGCAGGSGLAAGGVATSVTTLIADYRDCHAVVQKSNKTCYCARRGQYS